MTHNRYSRSNASPIAIRVANRPSLSSLLLLLFLLQFLHCVAVSFASKSPATVEWKRLEQDSQDRPSPRFDSGFAVGRFPDDPDTEMVLLFGGATEGGKLSNELFGGHFAWSQQKGTWQKLLPQPETDRMPAPRKDFVAKFVTQPRPGENCDLCLPEGLLVQGGRVETGSKGNFHYHRQQEQEVLGDIWFARIFRTFPSKETQVEWIEMRAADSGSNATLAQLLNRETHSSVFDRNAQKLILFGGRGPDGVGRNDVVSISSNRNLFPKYEIEQLHSGTGVGKDAPSPRLWSAMVDIQMPNAPERLCIFGGLDTTVKRPLNDLWCFYPQTRVWTKLSQNGDIPSPRSGHHMLFDTRSNTLVLFGGEDIHGDGLNDIYLFDFRRLQWTRLAPKQNADRIPTGRLGATFVQLSSPTNADAPTIDLLLFGGLSGWNNAIGYLDDVWAGRIHFATDQSGSAQNGNEVFSIQAVALFVLSITMLLLT